MSLLGKHLGNTAAGKYVFFVAAPVALVPPTRVGDSPREAILVARYLFADEAGCFTFNRNQNVSRYFIICTVTTNDLKVGDALHNLRHQLVWERAQIGDFFHATEEKQAIRDRVFKTILEHDFEIQATVCEKAKAQPQVRADKARFYKYPWFYHLKHGIAPHIPENSQLLVTTASLGTKKERLTFTNSLDDVLSQTVRGAKWVVDFRPSQTDPCLQLADYCAWAVQRKWERNDLASYDLVRDRISYEYELWKHGKTLYY
ncbi:DUF3800 domain-containing protein [Rhizobium laguerreae]|uniref:DUF3800 domain-containing protein n=1 Tax=Rhizobium laguerreae TaxID=1076926 RepID=UPI001C90D6DD|nr:DUF3800 domain-containing protein [Rhizobium laguerreae]MBY3134778.1 DUF3800 domain-containing protein [Rhizobium laguerreae]